MFVLHFAVIIQVQTHLLPFPRPTSYLYMRQSYLERAHLYYT